MHEVTGPEAVMPAPGERQPSVEAPANLLRDVDFFRDVDDDTLTVLEQHLHKLALPAGRQLFAEGDDSDTLYIVTSGRLEIRIVNGDGDGHRSLAQIGAGEVVGELGVLTGEPRSADVWAVRDTELIVLGRDAFDGLMDENPYSIVTLTKVIARRLVNEISSRKPQSAISSICVVPLSSELPMASLRDIIASALEQKGALSVLDSDYASKTSDWFHRREEQYDSLLYLADPELSSWTQLCVRQSDLILLIAEPNDPRPGEDLITYLNTFADGRICQFITLQPEGQDLPLEGQSWTRDIRARSRWNLILEQKECRERLARIATGRTVGTVFSGGGARGFAHLGIVKAMRENSIPIDQISGTSMGALMAAGIAMGWSFDDFRKRLHATFVDINPVGDYTLPIHSFARGRRLSKLLHQHFEEAEAASLWLPFFCTASNLTKGDSTCLASGPVWRAVRASLSIPGLVPPVLDGSDVLVDGGLINNLPIDVMDGINLGPVIGVDVGRAEGSFTLDPKVCDAGSESLIPHLGSPSIADVLMRSATIAGESNNRGAERVADLVLYPDVQGMSILNWRALDQMIERGYAYATSPETMRQLKTACTSYGATFQ
ncbi:MAG: patatin-like phospholipase family protein [Geminicoccaceae bacterium]